MMHHLLLAIFATLSLVISQPINIVRRDFGPLSDEIVYLPYDVEYVPVEVSSKKSIGDELLSPEISSKISKNNEINHDSNEDIKIQPVEDRYNTDPSRSSDKFVLVPVSVIKKLEDNQNDDSSKKTHTITKRQAPGGNFLVYRPVVQYTRTFRDRRRYFRRPALVGYINDYDDFPTVSVS